MTSTEQAKAYALRKTGLQWADLQRWTQPNRSAYLAAIAEFRRRNPQLFSSPADQAATANYEGMAASTVPRFSYVEEFFTQAGSQIRSLNSDLNPFATENRSRTRTTVIGVILAAAVVYFGVLAIRTSPPPPLRRRSD